MEDSNSDTSAQTASTSQRPGSVRSKLKRSISSIHGVTLEQKFTEQQKAALAKFSSVSYQPTHSQVYIKWLQRGASRFAGFWSSWDRWFLCFLIGLCVGLVAVILKQSLQALFAVRWTKAQLLIENNEMLQAWGWTFGFGALFIIFASWLVVFVHPPAMGGGSVESIAFLNGIIVHGTMSIRCLVTKLFGNVFAVSSGLPAGTQGPVIAMGAIVGAGVGNFQSKTFKFYPKSFSRLRTAEERRTFTTAGVASGVAAGFNAPVGGLLFAMEDLSSHWSKRISLQTFFSCIIATATASVFNTAFTGFRYSGSFGAFSLLVVQPIQVHILVLLPAFLLGIVGGLLGAIFTRVNIFVVGLRKSWILCLKKPFLQKITRMVETLILVCLMATFAVYIPMVFPCQTVPQQNSDVTAIESCVYQTFNMTRRTLSLEAYNCPPLDENGTSQAEVFNGAATLLQGSGTAMLNNLWTRTTSYAFTWQELMVIFPVWFFLTIWTCGTAISGGIFVPNLVSGALYGRLMGVGVLAIYQAATGEPYVTNPQWAWIDPGLMAVIGAGSLLAGVTRLGVASTVIVVEMSNDINTIIPVMISNMTAKLVADFLCKPLFKYQLDGKSLPVLEQEPKVVVRGTLVNLELFKAKDVMRRSPHAIHCTESVYKLASLLILTNHSGFPVVKYDEVTRMEHLMGIITRKELYVLLCCDEVYNECNQAAKISPDVPYEDVSVDYLTDPTAALERVRNYLKFAIYQTMHVKLDNYLNLSVYKVDEDFSLHRTYTLFRSMGLVNLCVTDIRNRVVGIITRKDLLPFAIAERLGRLSEDLSDDSISQSPDSGVEMNTYPTTPPLNNPIGLIHSSPSGLALPSLKEELDEDRSHSSAESVHFAYEDSPRSSRGSRRSLDALPNQEKMATAL